MAEQVIDERQKRSGLTAYLGPVILLALFLWLYTPVVISLFSDLIADLRAKEGGYSSHGLLVIPVSLILIWLKRKRLAQIEKRPAPAALLVVLFGAALLPVSHAAELNTLANVSLLLVIGGLIWHIWGTAVMREIRFPYLFLFFAIPWPSLLIETLTFPLQFIATKLASLFAGLIGLPVVRDGVEIQMGQYRFAVAAACSGMKSLVSLLALGAFYAYLLKGNRWLRLLLIALTIPLALLGNAVRITSILLIARFWGQDKAEGFYHGFSGMVVFLVTFILLVGFARLFGLSKTREEL